MWNLDVYGSLIREKLNNIYAFFSYWYMRYLLVTELYIVEPWERAVMHVIIMVFLCTLSYVNVHLIGFVSTITDAGEGSIYLQKIS